MSFVFITQNPSFLSLLLLTNLLAGQEQPAGVGGQWPMNPFFAIVLIIYCYQTSVFL